MGIYDDIDSDVLRNYQEFALVNIIYLALKESSTSEQSARMTAMDSASKNACKYRYRLLFRVDGQLESLPGTNTLLGLTFLLLLQPR